MCWSFTIASCALSLLLLAGCHSRSLPSKPVQRSQPIFGTYVTITVYADDAEQANSSISAAFGEFHRVDALMSIHREDSELAMVNSQAGNAPVPVSKELFDVLSKAQQISAETEGSFDVTIRPLADLWGFIWKEYRLPNAQELSNVLPAVNYRLIHLDATNRTISFLRTNVSIDLGGIGKGYAVDCAFEKLRSLGISNAMVKAGGDLRVIGTPPGQPFWTVQLEDPRKTGERIHVALRDAALSTSGNYENFFEIDGQRYSHILNPRTGLPVQGIAACTVIAPTCLESDALATAFTVYGIDRTFSSFGNRFGIQFTVLEDGKRLEVRANDQFPKPIRH